MPWLLFGSDKIQRQWLSFTRSGVRGAFDAAGGLAAGGRPSDKLAGRGCGAGGRLALGDVAGTSFNFPNCPPMATDGEAEMARGNPASTRNGPAVLQLSAWKPRRCPCGLTDLYDSSCMDDQPLRHGPVSSERREEWVRTRVSQVRSGQGQRLGDGIVVELPWDGCDGMVIERRECSWNEDDRARRLVQARRSYRQHRLRPCFRRSSWCCGGRCNR
jgi:hypothetical protein